MNRIALALLLLLVALPARAQYMWSGAPVAAAPSLVIPAENNVSTNWQNAGLATIGGIPTRNTTCTTINPSGKIPPTSGDDASLINAAISGCTAGQVVMLGTGTWNIANSQTPILVNKGITIRGTGSPVSTCNAATGTPCWGTVIQTYDGPQPTYNLTPQCGVTIGSTSNCPNSTGLFFFAPQGVFNFGWGNGTGCASPPSSTNPTTSSCGTTLTADMAQGDTVAHVTSTASFSVGMWVLIDENPLVTTTANPTGGSSILASPEFLNTTNSPAVMKLAAADTCCIYGFLVGANQPYRLNQELHKIASINAGALTITFDDAVTLAFRQSGGHDARLYWPTLQSSSTSNPFLQQAGIENVTLTRCNGGCVNFEFCALCWASNIEANYWIGGAVNFNYAARSTVAGSFLHDCIDCQNNGNEYPIGISFASMENLVENNIITFGGKGMVGRGSPTNVVANNYIDKTFYEATSIGDYWNDMGANGSHYGGTHHWLFEGNSATNCDGDETHGNAIDHTFFRNHCRGMRSSFTDPSNSLTVNDCAGTAFSNPPLNTPQTPAPLRAAGPMAFNYWYAFAGNVMGFSGIQSCAVGAFTYGGNSAGSTANKVIWHSGWTGSEWPGPDQNLNGVSNAFIFKNGNFDYVNNAIVDNATGYAHTFPSSLYLSGAPSYFGPGASCTYTWPWIDSTSGTPVKSNSCSGSGLPAKARADAGTPFVQP